MFLANLTVADSLRHIHDKPATDLLPTHPLLQTASRLSQAACRLAVHHIPFDIITYQWLGHRRHNLLHQCDQYITTALPDPTTTDKTNAAGRPEPTRPAREGEICSCGTPAVKVLLCEPP